MTSGKVQYVTAGGNYRAHGYTYHGAMQVLATMLRYEYLWTRIRIQGGAYGANASFSPSGIMTLSSYRDPKLKESLAAYRQLPEWLANLKLSERDLTKYVIGTISVLDTPLTNSQRCQQAAVQHLIGSTEAYRQQNRDQILGVKLEDLTGLAPLIKAVLSDNFLCVVGGRQAIEESQKEFKATISI
jgi:Zn-dependent M16 (insulinase) family peptidase